MTFDLLCDDFFTLKPVEYSKPYRIPYQGGKQLICKRLLDTLIERHPAKKYFVDLFGGGGSVSFYALHCGFKKVFYNELNSGMVNLIKYCLSKDNKLNDYNSRFYDFVTRDKFLEIKDSNPTTLEDIAYKQMVLICYSFSNNVVGYFCSPYKEIIKHNLHNLVVKKDYNSVVFIKDYFKRIHNVNDKYLEYWDKFCEMVKDCSVRNTRKRLVDFMLKYEALAVTYCFEYSGDFLSFLGAKQVDIVNLIKKNCKNLKFKKQKSGNFEFTAIKQIIGIKELGRVNSVENTEHLEQVQQLERLEHLEQLEQLQRLEHLEQLEQLQRLEHLEQLEILNYGYKDALSLISEQVDLSDAIIYCDPPYNNTVGYNVDFDYNGFLDWLDYYNKQGVTIYFSEYNAPYVCIWEQAKRCAGLDKTSTGGGIERVFINKRLK